MQKNMKKYLIGAHMPIAGGFYKAAIAGKEAGCSAIQIFTKSNRQWRAKEISTEDAKLFNEYLKECNIQYVVAHASYLINVCSPDKDTQKKSIDALIIELKRCNQLQIKDLVLHPGSRKTAPENATLEQAIENINLVLDNTPKDTRILLETMAGQGSAVGYKFEQLGKIISGIKQQDRIGVCFDTCHALAAGYNFLTNEDYETTWKEFDKAIGINKLKLFHFNDSKKDLGSRVDRHEHIGQGKVGEQAFKLILNDLRFSNIPKILETPKEGDLEDDKKNLTTLVRLIEKENLKHLKGTSLEVYL